MLIIFTSAMLTTCSLLYLKALFLTWQFDTARNKTVLVMGTSVEYSDINVVSNSISTITFLITFAAIVLSTVMLIAELHQKSKWRQTSSVNTASLSQRHSKRGTTLSKTIILLSVAVIVSYTPYTINCTLSAVLDGFMIYGKYQAFFSLMWSFSWLFETLNSSISILIYYNISSNYKKTFRAIFFAITLKLKDEMVETLARYFRSPRLQ